MMRENAREKSVLGGTISVDKKWVDRVRRGFRQGNQRKEERDE